MINIKRFTNRVALAVALLSASTSQAALLTGDIAFTSFNADEDGFSFVTFVDINANSSIFFTDNEFVGGAFNTGEGHISWNSGASLISAGSVIRFSDTENAASSSLGSISSGTINLSSGQDNIFAYLGTNVTTPTTFLAAIANGNYGSGSISALTGTGLTAGTNAISLANSTDFAQYTGVRSGEASFASYKPLVADTGNWDINVGGNQGAVVPNTTSFTAAVPEPSTYAMMALGLLGIFGMRRRNAEA